MSALGSYKKDEIYELIEELRQEYDSYSEYVRDVMDIVGFALESVAFREFECNTTQTTT